MRKAVLSIIAVFVTLTLVGVLGRVAFFLVHYGLIKSAGEVALFSMICHGLRLDMAVASYFSFLPGVFIILFLWLDSRVLKALYRCYQAVVALSLSLAFVANIALYSYWGFPLDSTPLFYLFTSPADAAASVPLWQVFALAAVWLIAAYGIYMALRKREVRVEKVQKKQAAAATVVMLLLTAFLIVPARGGFTVAVNNVGSVYFSENIRLNHATVNPVFNFLDSLTSDSDFASQYRFLDGKEADKLFSEMIYTAMRTDSTEALLPLSQEFTDALSEKRGGVNVVMVVLESFSKYIMEEEGHVSGVVPTMDCLADSAVYFTNFYANSFRTDRGLVSILSGFPAQPTMSLMKYPRMTNGIYAISRSLKNAGYGTQYVYGGDANFTNMRSYLHATGFDNIISEEDYDKSLRTSKWGVNDSVLFARALQQMEIAKTKAGNEQNTFTVVQTSSSHEPFDVPHHALKDEVLNAFHYTDYCLGRFIEALKMRDDWDRTLLVIVPDHLGCYPKEIDNFQLYRYEIPLILAGGAVKASRKIDTIGSQQDIAATLLALLRIDHSEFTYSKDLLDSRSPHFAFFAVPDAVGMVTDDNAVIYDNTSRKTVLDTGHKKSHNVKRAQAYLQKLYDDMAGM